MRAVHAYFLELAAASLDFELSPPDREGLATHLASCEPCRVRVSALYADARMIADLPRLVLAPEGVDRVYLKVQGPVRPGVPILRLVIIGCLLTILAVAAISVGAELFRRDPSLVVVPTSPSPSAPDNPPGSPSATLATDAPNASPTREPTTLPPPVASPTRTPNCSPAEPTPGKASPAPGALPVRAGTVQVAPGPDGGLYVVVNAASTGAGARENRAILSLLDAKGQPRDGWPVALIGWTCESPSPGTVASSPPLPAADGSVRVLCYSGVEGQPSRAFAFDRIGRPLRGWPVDLPGDVWAQPRVVGDTLHIVAHQTSQPDPITELYSRSFWLVTVDSDGVLRTGLRVEFPNAELVGTARVGLDGIAYLMEYPGEGTGPLITEITAFDLDGVRPGWPVRIEGVPSDPALGPDGRIYLTLGSPDPAFPDRTWAASPSRTIVFDRAGKAIPIGSDELPIAVDSVWSGAGLGSDAGPLVATDGTSFVMSGTGARTTVFGLDPAGRVMAGWPYRSNVGPQWQSSCAVRETGCGSWRSSPAIGPVNVLYLLLGPRDEAVGGSVVAINPDGWVRAGWPVELRRPGSEFWSVVVGPDGTAYVLAIEPEPGDRTSATILAIAPDSTVLYRTTVVEP